MNIQSILVPIRQRLLKIKNDNLHQININIKESTNSKTRIDILKEGTDLFKQFLNLGIVANKENVNCLKSVQNGDLKNLVKDVSNLIVDDKDWLLYYLSAYLDFCVDFYEYDSIGKEVLEIRSGYQFMIDLFKGCNENIDLEFQKFSYEIGEDFDKKLLGSKEYGTLKVIEKDMPRDIPTNHCWWFWNR
ncbi:hypothetical protein BpHYR1_012505 [Brachionus plicatilis]|uniref:Uncharacterized protein n=1 Tax=Brachionus plicatilis TaxID=10195 RepID=A0A3M7QJR9_BRAPC|nr:hypothetical protein BpHYR1_012505 [Brachionus plicatilis]